MKTPFTPCVFLSLLLFCALPTNAEEPEKEWQLFLRDTPYSIRYYNVETLVYDPSDLVRVWTKTIPTESGNRQIEEISTLWEIDCPKKVFRNLHTKVKYRNGHTEEVRAAYEWTSIQPEIWIGTLHGIVCTRRPQNP